MHGKTPLFDITLCTTIVQSLGHTHRSNDGPERKKVATKPVEKSITFRGYTVPQGGNILLRAHDELVVLRTIVRSATKKFHNANLKLTAGETAFRVFTTTGDELRP